MGESRVWVKLPKRSAGDLCPAAGGVRLPGGLPPAPGCSLRGITRFVFQDSDGDKSDDLVVDVSNEVSQGRGHFGRSTPLPAARWGFEGWGAMP